MVTAELVKELRESTGAGMMECKKVLVETNGDLAKAAELLRERGIAKAAKKSGRIAAEGLVDSYIHGDGRIGVLLEVNIETDFAAKNEQFKSFVKDIAMHIAAAAPEYVRREEVPAEVLQKEMEILKAQAINEGKPADIAEKIVQGRIGKFYSEICLLEQPYVKDPDMTVEKYVASFIATIGENINIRRFVRYERGEGLEKKEENFADEVMKQING
ncbi:MAG: translation elongation factor Ts [Clostridia bacterium]|nr:translation elongation factor Ts [Clostridia bacterium]